VAGPYQTVRDLRNGTHVRRLTDGPAGVRR